MKIGSIVFRKESTSAGRGATGAAACPDACSKRDSADGDTVSMNVARNAAVPIVIHTDSIRECRMIPVRMAVTPRHPAESTWSPARY